MKGIQKYLPIFLVGVVVVLLYLYSTWQTQTVREGFAATTSSPLTSLKIYSCPKGYEEVTVKTGKGNETALDCCEGGNIANDTCQGITFCTKGPSRVNQDPSKTISSCLEKWRTIFADHAKKCPSTMANYYEDLLGTGPKGCSASPATEDGKSPSDATQPKCIFYEKEEDKYGKKDSCTLEKDRLDFARQCPPVSGNIPTVLAIFDEKGKFKYFQCRYNDEPGLPNYCNDDANAKAYYDRVYANWQQSGEADFIKDTFCGNYIGARQKARSTQSEIQALKRSNETMKVQADTSKSQVQTLQQDLDAAKASNQRLQDRLKSSSTSGFPL
jgi:hypothetical protein